MMLYCLFNTVHYRWPMFYDRMWNKEAKRQKFQKSEQTEASRSCLNCRPCQWWTDSYTDLITSGVWENEQRVHISSWTVFTPTRQPTRQQAETMAMNVSLLWTPDKHLMCSSCTGVEKDQLRYCCPVTTKSQIKIHTSYWKSTEYRGWVSQFQR